jgi:hypothetical protein
MWAASAYDGRPSRFYLEGVGEFMPAMWRYFFYPNNPNKLAELLKQS